MASLLLDFVRSLRLFKLMDSFYHMLIGESLFLCLFFDEIEIF
jgi:hypothetical protein